MAAGFAPALLSAEQQFVFAIPAKESRISLGVFDAGGRLVRTLCAAAGEKSFRVEVNGLVASWDGKDDGGKAAPPGKYHVRGWAIGSDVKSEGVAYHFNDWITGEDSRGFSGLGAALPLARGLLIFGFRPARGSAVPAAADLWRWEETGGLAPLAELSGKAAFLAADGAHAAVADRAAGKVLLYRLSETREPLAAIPGGAVGCAAFWNGGLILGRTAGEKPVLERFDLETLQAAGSLPAPPVGFLGLDANTRALIGWDGSGVWLWQGKEFVPAPAAVPPPGFSASAGPEDSYWLAWREGPQIIVRQHAFAGELLREMKITEEFAETVEIFASKTTLEFCLILRAPQWSRQTLRGYRPAGGPPAASESADAQVDWEVFIDKTIENSRRFGFVENRLVSNAGETPQSTVQTINLPPGLLSGSAETISFKGASRPNGLWLQSEGLPVIPVGDGKDCDRILLTRGPREQSLRLFAGNGIVVAEYLVTGLGDVVALDAGEIDLP